MRKALIVGVDYYESVPGLFGCVSDANAVKGALETHSDGSVNFGVKLLAATGPHTALSRHELKDSVAELFAGDNEIALLYFAGHGHLETTGGYLCCSDCKRGDDGLPLAEVLVHANKSKATNRVIVLDSCHAGIAGVPPGQVTTELSQGLTILAASTEDQYASEENGSGVFSSLLVDALQGSACNLIGDVTPGGVYAHVDQSLGPWAQRPVFKTNVKSFVSLRRVQPPIPLADLQLITELFPAPGFDFNLDASFEPEERGRPQGAPPPNPENTAIFAVLQRYNRVNLLKPVGVDHMWHAAIEARSCRLTALGEHYRRLRQKGLI